MEVFHPKTPLKINQCQLKRNTKLDFDQSKIASWETFPSKTLVIFCLIQTFKPDQDEWAFNTRIFWFGMGSPGETLPQKTIHQTNGMNLPTWISWICDGKWLVFKYASPMGCVIGFGNSATKMTESSFFFQLDDFRWILLLYTEYFVPGFHTDLMLWIISVPPVKRIEMWQIFFRQICHFVPIRNGTSCTVWGCTLMLITRSPVMSGCLNAVVSCWTKNCN